jgi:hypothetical protein
VIIIVLSKYAISAKSIMLPLTHVIMIVELTILDAILDILAVTASIAME